MYEDHPTEDIEDREDHPYTRQAAGECRLRRKPSAEGPSDADRAPRAGDVGRGSRSGKQARSKPSPGRRA